MKESYNYGKIIYAVVVLLCLVLFFYSTSAEEQPPIPIKFNSTIEDSKIALQKINEVRIDNGSTPIEFDERAYWLALARSLDMQEYNYYYHTNPYTFEWVETIKADYGFAPYESPAENLNWCGDFTYADYNEPGLHSEFIDVVISSWIESPGHYFNIMYPNHKSGAIVIFRDTVIFYGINEDGYGSDYSEPLEHEVPGIEDRYYKGY